MNRFLLTTAALLLTVVPALAAEKPTLKDGNYLLKYSSASSLETNYAIVKIENKDGKVVGTLVAIHPQLVAGSLKLDGVAVEGSRVTVVLAAGDTKTSFEGVIDPKNDAEIRGSYGDDRRLNRGRLVPTDKDTIGRNEATTQLPVPESMRTATQLQNKPLQLAFQIRQSKDADEKAKLQKELEEARKEAEEKVPGLYRETIEKSADSLSAYDAALALLRGAEKAKAKAADVEGWVKVASNLAESFGPRFQSEATLQVAEILGPQKEYASIALTTADKAAATLQDAPLARQVRILKTLRVAQEAAGKTDLLKQTETKLAKLEEKQDEEYLKTVPPFKPEKYTGRKDGGSRVAVMELFTGAQCPPCVAADVAFDGLLKAYDAKDLVMIQYHMHIPGPDPLTNLDTIGRWDYYKNLFPNDMRGVPSSVFNGKPQAGGGGGMGNSEAKFKQYRGIIDPILDESSKATVKGKAVGHEDMVNIDVAVEGLKEPGSDVKLRLVLVEESIRYVGSNGIRFHHHVVRALPGGAAGVAVKELKDGKSTAKVNLTELRKSLKNYLDDFVANQGPFPNPDRPLALKDLKVIALVQDDSTGEILQAAQFDVAEGK